MFQKGEYIVYGNTGVCLVEDVGRPEQIPADRETLYYTLTPVCGTEKIYIPVTTSIFMRPVITREQALELIRRIPQIEETPCTERDQRLLEEYYRSLMMTHRCEDLVHLVKAIYVKGRMLAKNGKKPGARDTQYAKRAEMLLHGELAVALDIPLDEVKDFIRRSLAGDLEKEQRRDGESA